MTNIDSMLKEYGEQFLEDVMDGLGIDLDELESVLNNMVGVYDMVEDYVREWVEEEYNADNFLLQFIDLTKMASEMEFDTYFVSIPIIVHGEMKVAIFL